jgi:hypothetical protein
MTDCYSDTVFRYNLPGLFDKCVDGCFLLTMPNSSRKSQYMNQLATHVPCSRVVVRTNLGYKACVKLDTVNSPATDLTHALASVFVTALASGMNRVMVLEDDVQFTPEIKQGSADVVEFLNGKGKDACHVYNLGPNASFGNPFAATNGLHIKILRLSGTHACIYNADYMSKFIYYSSRGEVKHCDDHPIMKHATYMYKTTLAAQIFESTENKADWENPVTKVWIQLWNIDKSIDNYDIQAKVLLYAPWVLGCIVLVMSAWKLSCILSDSSSLDSRCSHARHVLHRSSRDLYQYNTGLTETINTTNPNSTTNSL